VLILCHGGAFVLESKDSHPGLEIDSPEEVVDTIRVQSLNLPISKKKILKKHNIGIPCAYTFAKGADGSAWIFFYEQTLGNEEYLKDKLYYNKIGQTLCLKSGLIYLGSDSGIYQRKDMFNMLVGQFTPNIQAKILKQCQFDQKYHQLGEETVERRHHHLVRRPGFNVGNGQGVVYFDNHLEGKKSFVAHKSGGGNPDLDNEYNDAAHKTRGHQTHKDTHKNTVQAKKGKKSKNRHIAQEGEGIQKGKLNNKPVIQPVVVQTPAGPIVLEPKYMRVQPVHTIHVPGEIIVVPGMQPPSKPEKGVVPPPQPPSKT